MADLTVVNRKSLLLSGVGRNDLEKMKWNRLQSLCRRARTKARTKIEAIEALCNLIPQKRTAWWYWLDEWIPQEKASPVYVCKCGEQTLLLAEGFSVKAMTVSRFMGLSDPDDFVPHKNLEGLNMFADDVVGSIYPSANCASCYWHIWPSMYPWVEGNRFHVAKHYFPH